MRNLQLVVDNKQTNTRAVQAGEARSSSYTINREKRLVAVCFGQKLTVEDIQGYAEALRRDPAFDAKFSELVDLTRVEEVTVDAGEAIELADRIDPFSPESKRAFVTLRPALFRAVRMHQILRSPAENIAIFESVAEAEQWLAPPKSSQASAGQVS